jgi:hypothetical protein
MFLFKGISTCLVANDQIFGVCQVWRRFPRGFYMDTKYLVIAMPGGISKRYPLEEKHSTYFSKSLRN